MDTASDNQTPLRAAEDLAQERRCFRVLMIAPTSFFADYGCHVRILEEARVLQKLGHRVTIVTYHNGGPVPGLDIRRTLPIPWRKDYEVGSSRHKIGFDVLLALKTLELLNSEKFDVIHAHLHEGVLIGSILGRVFRRPVVFDFQGSLTGEMIDHRFLKPDSRFYKPLFWLEKRLDCAAPAVLTNSAHAQNLLMDKFGCELSRVCLLPDCVNTEAFRPAAAHNPDDLAALRFSLGIPINRKLVVYLGLLAEYQGISLLLEAMALILHERQDAHLLLMGFPRVEFYRQRAAQLGISDFVTFTGRVPYQQAPGYLALGDVAVAPKLSETEGSGKLLNYMAVALPTVAFDTPVAREYLGPDGVFADPGNVTSLAEHLGACLFASGGQQEQLRHVGQRLRQRAIQHFGWDLVGRQIVDTYRRLLGEAPAPALAQPEWSVTYE